ncbi:STM4504/CBY_0614 family protein [Lysinibacillus sp. NPDC097162]|uniref:STM4504/CBY_0614 family protein n=1 Tax=Lysinibacillus sp. NPDC097162 TaxID=3364140 RepID=UPI003816C490
MGRSFYDFQVQMGFKEVSDVFQYEDVSTKMKNQFIFMVEKIVEEISERYYKVEFWQKVINRINVEYGKSVRTIVNPEEKVHEAFQKLNNEESLYFFELMLEEMDDYLSFDYDEFVKRVNKLFLENSFGYEFVEGQMIRIDSKFIHQEVILNAIQLLYEVEFESASTEYMQAFNDYKNGNLKGSITNAGKAFESTMKIICEELNYSYKQSDNAKKLISTLMNKEFIPSYLQTHFSGLSNTLESGLPTVRNKHSHGDGVIEVEVTDKIVRYALNLCATNIVLLVEIYNEYIHQG